MQGSTVNSPDTVVHYPKSPGGAAHHEEHEDHRLFGIFLFLVAESMIFLGLFTAYATFRLVSPVWPPEGTPETELLLPGINTLVLISSSFIMNRGQQAIKKDDVGGLRFWLSITAALGVLFMVGQGYEYFTNGFGLTDNLFASTFYVLTGFHGLHVSFGLLLIFAVLWRSLKKERYSSESHFGVEAAELYWHFVDVIWIILFGILYLW